MAGRAISLAGRAISLAGRATKNIRSILFLFLLVLALVDMFAPLDDLNLGFLRFLHKGFYTGTSPEIVIKSSQQNKSYFLMIIL